MKQSDLFVKKDAGAVVEVSPGVKRRVTAFGPDLMVVEVTFESADSEASMHSHPHVQSTIVVSGKCLYTIGDKEEVLEAGDTTFVPANVPHNLKPLGPCVVYDVFSPMREDFI